jgi:uncharacterized protein (DUF2236 family)
MSRVMPTPEEVPQLVPPRGGVVWRYAGDARLLVASGYALLLQVGHPTVGAGVSQFSSFKQDPWGRLFRTLDYTYSMAYGGPELAAEIGRRVRDMHKGIKGVRPDGERYHALEPEAYAWVHATLADAIVRAHHLFGRRLEGADLATFWEEWRRSGRLIGVRERDLPGTWGEFRDYFDDMVEHRLVDNEAVQDVLDAIRRPAPPPIPLMREGVWRLLSLPSARTLWLTTAGLLPPVLRARFGIPWSARDERRLRALAAASRAATPLMPKALLVTGPAYLRWRRKAIERGEVANPERAPGRAASAAAA